MLSRQVRVDLDDDADAVASRIRSRLRGPIGWGHELMLPVVKVGSGPPDFIGRVDGRQVCRHALWRPNISFGQRTLLAVDGAIVPHGDGCRLEARIAPRRLMVALWSFGAGVLLVGLAARSLPLLVVALTGVLYWLVVLRRDLELTEQGLRRLTDAPRPTAEPA